MDTLWKSRILVELLPGAPKQFWRLCRQRTTVCRRNNILAADLLKSEKGAILQHFGFSTFSWSSLSNRKPLFQQETAAAPPLMDNYDDDDRRRAMLA